MILLLSSLLLSGCSLREEPKPLYAKPSLILFSTPLLKFQDSGFIYYYTHGIRMEVYASGQMPFVVEIRSQQICLEQKCYPKSRMSREIFGERVAYPTLLEEILRGEDIFKGKNKHIEGEVIRQFLSGEGYEILYERSKEKIYFRDRIRRTLIILKEME